LVLTFAAEYDANHANDNVLLTGGAGFSGSHIADEIVATADWNVVVIDALTYAEA